MLTRLYRNLPNLLSAFRVLLAPFVAAAILNGRTPAALAMLAAAGLSDLLDGYLARRMGVSSRLGSYLDPLSDKFLLVTVYLCEGLAGRLPAWLVALVLGRDLLILAMAAYAMAAVQVRQFPPSFWGKLSTVVQIVVALIVLADGGRVLDRGLVLATVSVVTAWSGIHYVRYAAAALRVLLRQRAIDGGAGRG